MHDSPFSTSLLYSAEQSIQFQNFLSKHLPYTLPLLRRLQYEDRSAQAVIISSFNPDEAQSPSTWAIAFFDRFVDIGITSCVLSSSLDLPIHEKISKSQQDHDDVLRHLRAVFKSIKLRNVALSSPEDVVLVHSVKASTADALRHDPQFNAIRDDLNDINGTDDACYGKYLVRPSLLREAADSSLPHGFYYDAVRSWDLQLVANTSSLVPSARYLQGKPSAGIREESTGLLRACRFSSAELQSGPAAIIVHFDDSVCLLGAGL